MSSNLTRPPGHIRDPRPDYDAPSFGNRWPSINDDIGYLLSGRTRFARWVHLLLLALLGVCVVWAALFRTELATSSDGEVRPSVEAIPLAFGVEGRLASPVAASGLHVRRGMVLAQLDASAEVAQLTTLRGRLARIDRQYGETLAQTAVLRTLPDSGAAASQFALLGADARNHVRSVWAKVLRARVEREGAEHSATRERELAARGMSSPAALDSVERQVRRWDAEMAIVRATALSELSEKASTLASRAKDLRAEIILLQVAIRRYTIRAPVDGIISTSVALGQYSFVRGDETIVRLIPDRAHLVVRAVIRPADRGRVKVGDLAEIRFQAYDWRRYGTARGVVKTIAPDVDPTVRPGNGYVALIELDTTAFMRHLPPGQAIEPGMTCEVRVVAEEESLLTLILRKLSHGISQDS